jgi:hypothetical protein
MAGFAPQFCGVPVTEDAACRRVGEHDAVEVIDHPDRLRDVLEDPGQQCLRC